jgi:hypothetical protein
MKNINKATKEFEENLIALINNSGLPEINVLLVLKNIELLVQSEFMKSIEKDIVE